MCKTKGRQPPIHTHTHTQTNTHRIYATVLFALIEAGEVGQAREIAEKAPPALLLKSKKQKLLVTLARMERGQGGGKKDEECEWKREVKL